MRAPSRAYLLQVLGGRYTHIEMEMDSVHVGSDGTVTRMCVGTDSTINSLAELLARTQTVCLSYARTVSGRVRERVVQGTRQASVQMALGSHQPVLRVRTGMGGPSKLGMVTDYQPSAAPTYGRLPGLTMLRVYPVNCGNKLRVWTHLTALLELEVI